MRYDRFLMSETRNFSSLSELIRLYWNELVRRAVINALPSFSSMPRGMVDILVNFCFYCPWPSTLEHRDTNRPLSFTEKSVWHLQW